MRTPFLATESLRERVSPAPGRGGRGPHGDRLIRGEIRGIAGQEGLTYLRNARIVRACWDSF